MFGLFKSKNKKLPDNFAEIIAKELFGQIERARDDAKSADLVSEKIFNERLNSMFVAGYLIGYVDEHMESLLDSNSEKKENAEKVFESMFPGVGADFVKAKLTARKEANQIPEDSEVYRKIARLCMAFDKGMESALKEVEELKSNQDFKPVRLKEYLLLGEV